MPRVRAVEGAAAIQGVEPEKIPRHNLPSAVKHPVDAGGDRQRGGADGKRLLENETYPAHRLDGLLHEHREPVERGGWTHDARDRGERERERSVDVLLGVVVVGRGAGPRPVRERRDGERRLGAVGECPDRAEEVEPAREGAKQRPPRGGIRRGGALGLLILGLPLRAREPPVREFVHVDVARGGDDRLHDARGPHRHSRAVQSNRLRDLVRDCENERMEVAPQTVGPLPGQVPVAEDELVGNLNGLPVLVRAEERAHAERVDDAEEDARGENCAQIGGFSFRFGFLGSLGHGGAEGRGCPTSLRRVRVSVGALDKLSRAFAGLISTRARVPVV